MLTIFKLKIRLSETGFLLVGQPLRDLHLTFDLRPQVLEGLAQVGLKQVLVESIHDLFELLHRGEVRHGSVLSLDEEPSADEPVLVASTVEPEGLMTIHATFVVVVAVSHAGNLERFNVVESPTNKTLQMSYGSLLINFYASKQRVKHL